MKAYKLTDENNQTYGGTQWGENVTHHAKGDHPSLCSSSWIHFYVDPLLAVLRNPTDANFENPNLWECETAGEHKHETLKSGCKTLTTIKQLPLPQMSTKQRVRCAVRIAMLVMNKWKSCTEENAVWRVWAEEYLISANTTAAKAAADAAYAANAAANAAYAAYAAANAAANAAAYAAANAAANAANAAANAAYAAYAADAAGAAADAAGAADAADDGNLQQQIIQALHNETGCEERKAG